MTTAFKLWRDQHGIPHIEADTEEDMYRGQGYAHARDRGMQMLLMRILGKGRLSELLDASDDSLKTDMFFRRMNWSGNTGQQISLLSTDAAAKLEAYCAGVNEALAEKTPFELSLMGYKPEPWLADDCMLISRMVGYLTLAQSQGEIERLLIEMVQAGVPDDKLESLFPGLLTGLDRELINKVELQDRIVPNEVLWASGAPRMMASNNWVVAGSKTASGKPILANDPHLEVNRLPNVWCELALATADNWLIGSTMPGLPGVLIGRNKDLAWGATYAFVDSIDSWVEKCEGGKYFRQDGEQWHAFVERKETILRKKKPATEVSFYENELGTLEGDPRSDGHYLVTRWAASDAGAASVEAIFGLLHASTAEQGMARYGCIETGWNYVFADDAGSIGFQMSGKVPIRQAGLSGLVPTAAWDAGNHWQGFISVEDMPRSLNPECGFICTANDDLNHLGKASPINMPMGSYRADRIADLLAQGDSFKVADMCEMHFDVYSRQAELFMGVLRPLLPATSQGDILRQWDCRYDADSKGAYLFEHFYKALLLEVFGERGMGREAVQFLQQDSGTFIDFYANFDRILMLEESIWFGNASRDAIFQQVAEGALSVAPAAWKTVQEYTMSHILLGGKLPKWLGYDRGPFIAIGGRATIHQGQIYRSEGRDTSFLPSFRMVTDFAEQTLHTNLAGGPSDRRFSPWYCSDLENWLAGRYKEVSRSKKAGAMKF